MNSIYLMHDYQQLVGWMLFIKPYSKIKIWRANGEVFTEGPDGRNQEVGLAGLVNDY